MPSYGCLPRMRVGGLGHLVCCSSVSRVFPFSSWHPSVLTTLHVAVTESLFGDCVHVLPCMAPISFATSANSRNHNHLLMVSRCHISVCGGQTSRRKAVCASISKDVGPPGSRALRAIAPEPTSSWDYTAQSNATRTFGYTPATLPSTFMAHT